MQLELPPAVHAVMIDDDLVLLDADADIYFCLPLPNGLARLEGRGLHTADAMLGAELIGAGLARPASGQGPDLPALPVTPTRTARAVLEDHPDLLVRFRPIHLVALIAAVRAALASRRETFGDLIASTPRPVGQGRGQAALLADLAVWRRITPWLPLDGLCLFRSRILLAFLHALGHRPGWVFGVRTWPFRAHCWLQAGDMVLDDEAERVSAFAPILAA